MPSEKEYAKKNIIFWFRINRNEAFKTTQEKL